MSEQQEIEVNELIKEARCAAKDARDAKRNYSILIRTLVVAIIIAISSVPLMQWQIAKLNKDYDYVRETAVNKKAFYNLMDTYKANIDGITKLIGDEDVNAIVNEFNARTDAIINKIMSAETEIVPRGISESKRGGSE